MLAVLAGAAIAFWLRTPPAQQVAAPVPKPVVAESKPAADPSLPVIPPLDESDTVAADLIRKLSSHPLVAGLLLASASAAIAYASRALRAEQHGRFRLAIVMAAAVTVASIAVEIGGHVQSGLEPTQSSYGAVVYMVAALQAQYVLVLAIVAGYVLARSWHGMLDRTRRVTFDNVMLLWHYAVVQGANLHGSLPLLKVCRRGQEPRGAATLCRAGPESTGFWGTSGPKPGRCYKRLADKRPWRVRRRVL